MEKYSYSFEIRSCLLHFLAAIDGGIVKRYDENRKAQTSIKVNYVYGNKQSVLKDILDKNNHIRLPIVMVSLKGLERDPNRVTDNINGRFLSVKDPDIPYSETNGIISNIPPAVPVNLSLQVDLWAKFQADMEQMLTNFIAWSDPYIIIPWKEPMTNQIIRSAVYWDGNVSYTTPERQTKSDQFSRIEASTSFTFQGFVFKDKPVEYGKICTIKSNYIVTPNSTPYENYTALLEASANAPIIDRLTTYGIPEIRSVNTAFIQTSSFGDIIRFGGWFPQIQNVFLSGTNIDMISGGQMSAFDPFPDDISFPAFSALPIESFNISNNHVLTFEVPAFILPGFVDIIITNPCGYSKLSEDYIKIQTENPYPSADSRFQMWIDINEPYKNGLEVVDSNNWALSCTTSPCIVPSVSSLSSEDTEC